MTLSPACTQSDRLLPTHLCRRRLEESAWGRRARRRRRVAGRPPGLASLNSPPAMIREAVPRLPRKSFPEAQRLSVISSVSGVTARLALAPHPFS